MSDGPVPLRPVSLEPSPAVVDFCRDLLRRAEAGEIRAIAIAAHIHPNSTTTGWARGDGDVAHIICSIERVKLRLLQLGEE